MRWEKIAEGIFGLLEKLEGQGEIKVKWRSRCSVQQVLPLAETALSGAQQAGKSSRQFSVEDKPVSQEISDAWD